MRKQLYIWLIAWLPTFCGATIHTISLTGDTTVMGGWTIAVGDTVNLNLNQHTVAFDGNKDYGDFGLHVYGQLNISGQGVLTHERHIAQLVEINQGGCLNVESGTWEVWSSKNGLFRLMNGELHIAGGTFQTDATLIDATRDSLSISGGQFDEGVDPANWFKIGSAMRVSLRGGSFALDPRTYGLQPDEGYAVYPYTEPHASNKNYYVALIPPDTTISTDTTAVDTIPIILPDTNDIHVYENLTACDSIWWRGEWRYTQGEHIERKAIDALRDSVFHLYLDMHRSTIQHRQIRTCDSYFWRGRELTESGEYYDTLQTVAGCDSIVHLSLTLGRSTEIYRDTVHICAGQSYTWIGKTYTRAGVYQQVLETSFPCDSFVELHLVIDGLEQDSVPAQALHGFRMLVLDHNTLAQQGYNFRSEDVSWYRVANSIDDPRYPGEADDVLLGHGDYYSGDGNPLKGSYYAIIRQEDEDPCHLPTRSVVLTAPSTK